MMDGEEILQMGLALLMIIGFFHDNLYVVGIAAVAMAFTFE